MRNSYSKDLMSKAKIVAFATKRSPVYLHC